MKVQQSNVSFGVNWNEARKVLHALPEQHKLFQQFDYTLDEKTLRLKKFY